MHNFYQVEEVLRQLKVPFDAKLIHQVMNEEKGAAMRLLKTIKLKLDQHFSDQNVTVTNLKKKVVDGKVQRVGELADKLPEIHRQYGVTGPSISSKKMQIIEKKLLKYEVARVNLEKKAEADYQAEKTMLRSI